MFFYTGFYTGNHIRRHSIGARKRMRTSRAGGKEAEGGEVDILVAWRTPAFSGAAEESGKHQPVDGDLGGRAKNYVLLLHYRLIVNPDPDDAVLLARIIEHDLLLYLNPAAHRKMPETTTHRVAFETHHVRVEFALSVFAPHQAQGKALGTIDIFTPRWGFAAIQPRQLATLHEVEIRRKAQHVTQAGALTATQGGWVTVKAGPPFEGVTGRG